VSGLLARAKADRWHTRNAELYGRLDASVSGDEAIVLVDENRITGLVKPNVRIESAICFSCALECVRGLDLRGFNTAGD
jgi:hypothetical protein